MYLYHNDWDFNDLLGYLDCYSCWIEGKAKREILGTRVTEIILRMTHGKVE